MNAAPDAVELPVTAVSKSATLTLFAPVAVTDCYTRNARLSPLALAANGP